MALPVVVAVDCTFVALAIDTDSYLFDYVDHSGAVGQFVVDAVVNAFELVDDVDFVD